MSDLYNKALLETQREGYTRKIAELESLKQTLGSEHVRTLNRIIGTYRSLIATVDYQSRCYEKNASAYSY